MMAQLTNTPPTGLGTYRGEPYKYYYEVTRDLYVSEFMGEEGVFLPQDVASNPYIVKDWADLIYQAKKGSTHGLSGQSTQANSGGSTVTQFGGGGGGVGNSYLSQLQNTGSYQQAAAIQQQQLAYQLGQQQLLNQWAAQGFGRPTQSNPKPLKTEGFRLGEIIGWRGWKVTPTGFLRSMSADCVWAPDEPMDGKTTSTGDRGVYAFKKCKDFLHEMENCSLEIYGRVALWGDVIEHELGYRAEFAKVISLDHFLTLKAPHGIGIKELRQRYKVAA